MPPLHSRGSRCGRYATGGSNAWKVGNMISRLQVTQKVHQLGQHFGWVLRPQTHKGTCGAMPLFRAQKSIIANKVQNQNSLTSIDSYSADIL